MDDGVLYNGKTVDLSPKMAAVIEGVQNFAEFEGLISLKRFEKPMPTVGIPRVYDLQAGPPRQYFGLIVRARTSLQDFLKKASADSKPFEFERVDFHDPLLIVLYVVLAVIALCSAHGCFSSSGTTGVPKVSQYQCLLGLER
jgi:acetoacetyl-CoA synthetase